MSRFQVHCIRIKWSSVEVLPIFKTPSDLRWKAQIVKLVEEMRKAEQKSQTLVKADIGRLKCFVKRRICRIYIVGSSFWEGGISFLKEGSRYQETIRKHAKLLNPVS